MHFVDLIFAAFRKLYLLETIFFLISRSVLKVLILYLKVFYRFLSIVNYY